MKKSSGARKKQSSSTGRKELSSTGKKRTKFGVEADDGNEVYVAGNFNGWNPRKNRLKFKDGRYSTTVMLAKGKYQYKFIVDGVWCVDPKCAEWAPNGLGSLNSVITVG